MKFIKRNLYRDLDKEVNILWISVIVMSGLVVLLTVLTISNMILTSRAIEVLSEAQNAPVTSVSDDFYANLDPCVMSEDISCDWNIDLGYELLTNQTVYGYNSQPNQTDSTPCITASGLNVCTGTGNYVANNCYSFGTIVNINSVDYEVVDRMNKRYDCSNFDMWFPTYHEAIQWGKRTMEIKIYD